MRATELLLQERVPRQRPITEPRPRGRDVRVRRKALAVPVRRYRTPHTIVPHTQFLSNGKYAAAVTNAGGGASFCDRMAVTRSRRDSTTDPGSHFIYLRDIRSGEVWSPTYLPDPARARPIPRDVPARDGRLRFEGRRDRRPARSGGLARARRRGAAACSSSTTAIASARSTSPATSRSRWRTARDDFAHPAFGKLFIETEYLPERAALICHRRPRDARDPGTWAVHVLSLEGRAQGPLEWETDRAQFIGRGRTLDRPHGARRPAAVGHDRLRARSDPQPAPARAAARRRVGARSALPPGSRPIAKPPARWR